MTRLVKSVGAYFKAIEMASDHSLWKFLWIPGLVSLLVAAALITLVITAAPWLASVLVSWYPWEFGRGLAEWSAVFSAYVMVIALAFIAYKYLVLIITFPFMSFLSQKVEKIKYGQIAGETKQPVLQFISELWRGVGISTVLLIRELGLTFLLFVLSLIPGVAIITAPAIFLVQSYYAGCCNMDYTLERYFNIHNSLRFMRSNSDIALGNGMAFIILLSLPVIGIFFAPILGTIAATTQTLDVLEEIDYGG